MTDEKQIQAFVSSHELAKKVAETLGSIGFVDESHTSVAGLKRLQVFDDTSRLPCSMPRAMFASSLTKRKLITFNVWKDDLRHQCFR